MCVYIYIHIFSVIIYRKEYFTIKRYFNRVNYLTLRNLTGELTYLIISILYITVQQV